MIKKEMITAVTVVGMILTFKSLWKSFSEFEQTAFRGYALLGKEKFLDEVKLKEKNTIEKIHPSLSYYEKADPSFSVEKGIDYVLSGLYYLALHKEDLILGEQKIVAYVKENPPYVISDFDLFTEIILKSMSPKAVEKLQDDLLSGNYKTNLKNSALFKKLIDWEYCSEQDVDEHIEWITGNYQRAIHKLRL